MEKSKVLGEKLYQKIEWLRTNYKILSKIIFIAICVLLSVPAVLLGKSGLFRSIDYIVEDGAYQNGYDAEETVVIISISSDDFNSSIVDINNYLYDIIVKLYKTDINAPAVLGIDYPLNVVSNADSAEKLASIVQGKDVVVNETMNLSSAQVIGDNGFLYSEDNTKFVKNTGAPYKELADNVEVGYSNLFYDKDGNIRHYAWTFTDEYGTEYDSFAKKCFKLYASKTTDYLDCVRTTGDDVMYLSFYGEPGTVKQYTATEVLKNDFDYSVLAGKIVLIGQYDSSLAQEYFTAISKTQTMYNVEVQANAIMNAVKGKQCVEIKLGIQLLLLLVFESLMIYHLLKLTFVRASIYFLTMMALNLICSNIAWAAHHPYHLLFYVVAYTVAYIISIAVSMQRERIVGSKTNNTITQVMDPKIKEKVFQEGTQVKLDPVCKKICIMFADLRNFTAVSSSMDSRELVDMLNEYFLKATECIKNNDGTIDKYNGDAIMAFWGAPDDVDDCVYKACKAALDICHTIEDLNKEIYEKYERNLSFGIGINYGEATVGFIGSDKHKEYTAIGDSVNVASRVESLAPRGCVYITKAVKDILGDRARISSFDHKYMVKGKIDPIELYLLEALDDRHGYYQIQSINEVSHES